MDDKELWPLVAAVVKSAVEWRRAGHNLKANYAESLERDCKLLEERSLDYAIHVWSRQAEAMLAGNALLASKSASPNPVGC